MALALEYLLFPESLFRGQHLIAERNCVHKYIYLNTHGNTIN